MTFLFLSELSLLCECLALQLRYLQILLLDGLQQVGLVMIRVLLMFVGLGPPPPSYPVHVLVVPVEHPGQPVEAVVFAGGGGGGGRGRRGEGQTAAHTTAGGRGSSVSDGGQSPAVVVNHRVGPRAGRTVQRRHLIGEMSEH